MSPILRRMVQLLLLTAVQGVVLFASAGDLSWPAGWVYLGAYAGMITVAAAVLLPRRPEVVAERSRGRAGGKTWDLWITRLLILPSLGILAVAGLAVRWDWSPSIAAALRLPGVALFVTGYALVVWAMYCNTYFSQVVRIQTERGHTVVSDGPYARVRHPGYVGMTASAFGSVLLLGSAWSLVPWVLYLVLIVVRTALEDRTLRAELPGYADYATRTRYRLVPRVW